MQFFFFNDTATTEIYTLSLHDALPISADRKQAARKQAARKQAEQKQAEQRLVERRRGERRRRGTAQWDQQAPRPPGDRKSTRLNSSHANISYAVFCLKKKKK